MTEEATGQVLTEATFQGRKCYIIEQDYWHLTHLKGRLLHNAYIGKGFCWSISGANLMPGMENAVTDYGLNARFSDKEADWELVREHEFPFLPTRLNALFLFDDEEVASRAANDPHWFGDEKRELVRVRIIDGAREFRADARWLDSAGPGQCDERARRYWSGEMTNEPMPEIIICGLVYFPDWQQPPFG